MFDESDTLLDRVCGAVLLASIAIAGIWYVGFALPERDAKLWAIHECYVNTGCEAELGAPSSRNLPAERCWADCTEIVAHYHHGSDL